jgi:hypothetical protein
MKMLLQCFPHTNKNSHDTPWRKTYNSYTDNKTTVLYVTHTALRKNTTPSDPSKKKLTANNAMIVKSDKSNSIIVVYQQDYQAKIRHFISNNKFEVTDKDPTDKYRKFLRQTFNNCKSLILLDTAWNLINLNPTAPTIRGLINVHKTGQPIRPIVNWTQAPAYKIAKMLITTLETYITLSYTFNVKNTTHHCRPERNPSESRL